MSTISYPSLRVKFAEVKKKSVERGNEVGKKAPKKG